MSADQKTPDAAPSPNAPDNIVTGALQPLSPAAELAQRALVPLVAGRAARCPRCGTRLLSEGSRTCPRCGVDPGSAEAGAMLVPQGSWIREFIRGATYVPRGFFRILTTPRLWSVSALPLLLNVIIFLLMWYVVINVLQSYLRPFINATRYETWTGPWWTILEWIVWSVAWLAYHLAYIIVPLILAWLTGAFPFSFIFRVIFAPLATMVSERTEQVVLDLPAVKAPLDIGSLTASMTTSVIDSLLLVMLQGLLYLVLLPIALIPIVGTFFWIIIPPAIMAGMDHSDPNYCRKTYAWSERIALWKARHWRFLGFGCAFFFLLGIPFVNAVVFPTVAAGGCLLYLELDRK